MKTIVIETMKQYNESVKRYKKAEQYFGNDTVPYHEKLMQTQNCHILTNHMGGLIHKMRDLGYQMSDEEILEGFRQVEFLQL